MQSINLYHGSLLPKPESIPFWMVNLAVIAGLVVSALWISSEWQKNQKARTQLKHQQQQQQQIEASLRSMQEQIPSAAVETKIRLNIVELQHTLKNSQALYQMVQRLDGERPSGFSGILTDLSTLPNKDFWFTHINLANNGVHLKGKTYESAAIANLVSRLQILPNTRQTQFGNLVITRDSARKKIAEFSLASPKWEDEHATQ